MASNYQTVIDLNSNNPDYTNLDKFVFRLLNDIVTQSTRTRVFEGKTELCFKDCGVVEAFTAKNIQDEKNKNGTRVFISFNRNDQDPRNYNGNHLNGTSTIHQAYYIYSSISAQEGSIGEKLLINKILDGLVKELTSNYTYQDTVNGIAYSCPLQQSLTPPQDRATMPEKVNTTNYLTSTLTIIFKISK